MRFDYIFKDTHSIREAQVCQCVLGEIIIKVVITPDYKTADEEELRRLVARWISPQLKVIIVPVKALERELNGKLRAVKSTINTRT
jgi:phenylacetate-CoA ligase